MTGALRGLRRLLMICGLLIVDGDQDARLATAEALARRFEPDFRLAGRRRSVNVVA